MWWPASGHPRDSCRARPTRPGHGQADWGGNCKKVNNHHHRHRHHSGHHWQHHHRHHFQQSAYHHCRHHVTILIRFGFEDEYYDGSVSWWQHTKPRIWSAFDEPYSSNFAKVNKLWNHWMIYEKNIRMIQIYCLVTKERKIWSAFDEPYSSNFAKVNQLWNHCTM